MLSVYWIGKHFELTSWFNSTSSFEKWMSKKLICESTWEGLKALNVITYLMVTDIGRIHDTYHDIWMWSISCVKDCYLERLIDIVFLFFISRPMLAIFSVYLLQLVCFLKVSSFLTSIECTVVSNVWTWFSDANNKMIFYFLRNTKVV